MSLLQKNYLNKKEIFLKFLELLPCILIMLRIKQKGIPMTMHDWAEKTRRFF